MISDNDCSYYRLKKILHKKGGLYVYFFLKEKEDNAYSYSHGLCFGMGICKSGYLSPDCGMLLGKLISLPRATVCGLYI